MPGRKRPLAKRTKAAIYFIAFVAIFIPITLKNPCERGFSFKANISAMALSPLYCGSDPLSRLVIFYSTKISLILDIYNRGFMNPEKLGPKAVHTRKPAAS